MNIISAIYTDPVIALELIAIVLCALHIIKTSFTENQIEEVETRSSHYFKPHLIKI